MLFEKKLFLPTSTYYSSTTTKVPIRKKKHNRAAGLFKKTARQTVYTNIH